MMTMRLLMRACAIAAAAAGVLVAGLQQTGAADRGEGARRSSPAGCSSASRSTPRCRSGCGGSPKAPKDDYDEKAVRTLRNLERAGLVTVTENVTADSAKYIAKVTKKGFPILGTAPSHRGPVYRATIAEKVYDGLRNFVRHPTEPTVGHAELVWHYDNPTPLYPLFETKIDKPLKTPFVSHVSFWYAKHQWRFEINVKKTRAA